MAEEQKYTTGSQPYQYGQDTSIVAADDEPTGLENVGYDKVTMQGAPDNPKSAQEVVERGVVNVANDGPTTSTDTDSLPTDTSGIDHKIKTLQDFLDKMEQPESEEQRKKRERKEKSAKIVSAISDGIRAMSNLFFTSQYAPNGYNHEKESNLTAQNTAIEKAKKDREANADRYLKYALSLGDAENERAKTVREAEAAKKTLQLKVNEDKRRQAKSDYDAEMADINLQIKLGKLGYEEAKKRQAEAKATLDEAYAANADEIVLAKINKDNRAYTGKRSSGSSGSSVGKGSAGKYFDVEDKDGNIVRVNMTDLNDYYEQTDAEIKQKHRQTDSWGDQKTPTQEEMKQSVTEHLRTKGNTYRQRSRGSSGGGLSSGSGGNTTTTKQSPTAGTGKKSPTA